MPIVPAPPMIIFINTDLVQQVQGVFQVQFYLTQILDGPTFDGYVATIPNYVNQVHMNGQRIMVMRSLFDTTNRQLADIVLFAKAGLVSVLINKFGPPGITLPIARVTLLALITLNNPPPLSKETPDIDDGFVGEEDSDDFDSHDLDPNPKVEPVKL